MQTFTYLALIMIGPFSKMYFQIEAIEKLLNGHETLSEFKLPTNF